MKLRRDPVCQTRYFRIGLFQTYLNSKIEAGGLSLLRNKIPTRKSIIYTICYSAIAYWFIVTIVNLQEDADLALELGKNTKE
ncbi:hypothetical protein PDIG_27900 [Penicillium digitatum PHI26]|uniref:Uncharacterized protein n=2 Tax=Penicillium digitatum TaxID=36651 RepID=K9G180_PEND2|nr:hypothetical protein PDIP_62340 [Penicillium digitatum Pd1]EKV09902.1 hypothetical protein PDIP_62340 [Penicillium digitatum Pd1]EKV15109.1 hypothetical protein PDIG_27900 [Penicillium digitatum PHI26]